MAIDKDTSGVFSNSAEVNSEQELATAYSEFNESVTFPRFRTEVESDDATDEEQKWIDDLD